MVYWFKIIFKGFMMKKIQILIILLAASLILLQTIGYCENKPSALEFVRKGLVTSETIDLTKTGLRVYKPGKCYEGYVLFNSILATPELDKAWVGFAPIYLLDAEGEIAYRWIAPMPVGFSRLDKNGHLFYIGHPPANPADDVPGGLYELDPKNNEVWNYQSHITHDFRILGNDLFIVLDKTTTHLPSVDLPGYPFIASPHIDIISRDKKVLWSWQSEKHTLELKELSGKKIPPFDRGSNFAGDWLHFNTCEILSDNPIAKKDSRFRKGNIVFCSFNMDLIGIIEYPSGKIVWTFGPGVLDGPHSPTMLDNGNFLILDNGVNRGWSRVIEIDPLKKEISWEYRADPPGSFFSSRLSSATRLPNGNTFICDGVKNRLFEITPDGEVVWDMMPMFDATSGYFGILRAEKYSREYVKPLLGDKQE